MKLTITITTIILLIILSAFVETYVQNECLKENGKWTTISNAGYNNAKHICVK